MHGCNLRNFHLRRCTAWRCPNWAVAAKATGTWVGYLALDGRFKDRLAKTYPFRRVGFSSQSLICLPWEKGGRGDSEVARIGARPTWCCGRGAHSERIDHEASIAIVPDRFACVRANPLMNHSKTRCTIDHPHRSRRTI